MILSNTARPGSHAPGPFEKPPPTERTTDATTPTLHRRRWDLLMGWQLALAASGPRWAKLSDKSLRVLYRMAAIASDRDAEYWAGIGPIMACLIGHEPPRGSAEYDAARRRIHRYITELINAGAIEQTHNANGRHKAKYRLLVDISVGHPERHTEPVDNPVENPHTEGPSG